jgi:hypothetical protein
MNDDELRAANAELKNEDRSTGMPTVIDARMEKLLHDIMATLDRYEDMSEDSEGWHEIVWLMRNWLQEELNASRPMMHSTGRVYYLDFLNGKSQSEDERTNVALSDPEAGKAPSSP